MPTSGKPDVGPRGRPAARTLLLQLLRKIHHCLAIDLGAVPLAHHLEIPRALAVGRAGLPAVGLQQVGGGGQHVRHRVAQVDMAVAVVVDAVFDVRAGQELRLADLAGEGALEIVQGQVAALHDLQGGDQLALEQLGAAAVVRQRGDGAHHRHLAEIAGAVVALQRPDRHDQLFRHAELALDPRQQLRVAGHQRLGALDAGRDDARAGVFLEGLAEGVALAPVEVHHHGVGREPREGLVDDALRHAGGRRLAAHGGDEGVEVAAALGRIGRGSERDEAQESCEQAGRHTGSSWVVPRRSFTCRGRACPASRFFRPHPEERCAATRLEGWGRPAGALPPHVTQGRAEGCSRGGLFNPRISCCLEGGQGVPSNSNID